jgi:hypothetical protein
MAGAVCCSWSYKDSRQLHCKQGMPAKQTVMWINVSAIS